MEPMGIAAFSGSPLYPDGRGSLQGLPSLGVQFRLQGQGLSQINLLLTVWDLGFRV